MAIVAIYNRFSASTACGEGRSDEREAGRLRSDRRRLGPALSAVPGDRGCCDLVQLRHLPEFPPPGLSLHWYQKIVNDPEWLNAFWVTIKVGVALGRIATVVGVPAAFALVRHAIPGKSLLNALILSALVTPPIVTALSTYSCFIVQLGFVNSVFGLACAQRWRAALRGDQHRREPAQRGSDLERAAIIHGAPPAMGDASHYAADHHRRGS